MANIATDVYTGTMHLLGARLHVTKATLKGFEAILPQPVETTDQYYLSNHLDTFSLPANYYYPSASDYTGDLHNATLTSNVPEETITFSITSGHISPSYMDDFYYRIHISERQIDFGNILAGISRSIKLWNSYLHSVTLTDVTYINTDANIDTPTPPTAFAPLQEIDFTVGVLTEGIPILSGNILFQFDIGELLPTIVPLGITGTRVIIWPYIPNVSFTEIREWYTDVVTAYAGEERYNMREVPRLSLNYTCEFLDLSTYIEAQALAHKSHDRALALPLLTDFRRYNLPIASDATVLTMPTANLEVKAGGQVMIWESITKVEVLEILTVTENSITLRYPTQNSYTEAWIAPAFIGFTENTKLDFTISDDKTKTVRVNITALDTYNVSNTGSYSLFQGLPVVDDIPILTGGLNSSFNSEYNTIDSTIGAKTNLRISENNYHSMQLAMKAITAEKLWKYRRLLDYIKGKYQPFFIPSSIEITTNVSQVAIGSNQFLAYGRFLTVYEPSYLKLNSDPPMYVEVAEVNTEGLPSNQVSIILTAPTTVVLLANSKIEMLFKVRLDTDRIELNHPDKIATDIRPPIVTIPE